MGWSWALFFCHSMLTQVMINSSVGDPRRLEASVVRERAPAPVPTEARCWRPTLTTPTCLSESSVDAALGRLKAHLDELGVKYHEVHAATQTCECLGVEINGASLTVRPKPEKRQRLYRALQYVKSVGCVSGRVMQVLLGHIVAHFMLLRPGLSALRSLYRLTEGDLTRVVPLTGEHRHELQMIRGLVWLAEVQLDRRWSPLGFCSDSRSRC